MKIPINVSIDTEDLALSLTSDEALEFIKIIDQEQFSWSFTFECAKYFIEQMVAGGCEQGHLPKLKEMLNDYI